MFNLCIAELGEIIHGQVRLGAMPPLAGMLEPIGRIVVDPHEIQPRDVLWTFAARRLPYTWPADEAFARGAMGVVGSKRNIEPWAGGFVIHVDDPQAALHRLMRCLRKADGTWPKHVFSNNEPSAQVLSAVWRRDDVELQSLIEALDKRAAAVA